MIAAQAYVWAKLTISRQNHTFLAFMPIPTIAEESHAPRVTPAKAGLQSPIGCLVRRPQTLLLVSAKNHRLSLATPTFVLRSQLALGVPTTWVEPKGRIASHFPWPPRIDFTRTPRVESAWGETAAPVTTD